MRYRFENLLREISSINILSHYSGAPGLINLTKMFVNAVHLLGLRALNISVNLFGIILAVMITGCLGEMLRCCVLKTTRFLLS